MDSEISPKINRKSRLEQDREDPNGDAPMQGQMPVIEENDMRAVSTKTKGRY